MSIELPVDIGENALKYSTPDRLQEILVAVIEYLMTSENTPEEWIEFLSADNHQTLILLAQTTERLVEAEQDEWAETNTEDEAEEEEEEEEDEEDDYHNASALSLICQILVMFGSLNTTTFCPIITEHAFPHIMSSLHHHRKLCM